MFRYIDLPNAQNVVAGQTFVIDVPVAALILGKAKLALTNITHAQITDLKVKIDTKDVQEFATGTDLQTLNSYYNRPNSASHLTIYFERPELREKEELVTGLGMANVGTVRIQGKLDAAVVNPSIKAQAALALPLNEKQAQLGLITKVKQVPYQAVAGSQDIVDQITRGPGIMAMHFMKNDVTRLEVATDGRNIFEGDKADIQEDQKDWGRVPVAGHTTADFILRGGLESVLVTKRNVVQDLRFKPTVTAAAACPIYVEYLDTLSGV